MNKKHRQVFNDINITPLTDIFLVLLIIMMVVAPMLDYRGLKLSFFSSTESTPPSDQDPKIVSVTIDATGAVTVDGAAVAREALGPEVRQRAVEKPDGVIIEVDPDSTHESLTYVLDVLQSAGITKLSVTEAGPPEAAAPGAPASPSTKPSTTTKAPGA